ncbi:MAG: MBL fold metallo-hydrolase [Deltaproteobacteria bacterium]|nr:MBL fold metallo-hydrolase [Deltaproteobacteria bacterium]
MILEVCPDIFRIEVPLPENPLQHVNSYVVMSGGAVLIVDTGFNLDVCDRVLPEGLAQLGVDAARAEFFITHMHPDHAGLVHRLAGQSKRIYCGAKEIRHRIDRGLWARFLSAGRASGLAEADLEALSLRYPAFHYDARWLSSATALREGDVVTVGDYRFECVETPGHTMGHACLFDPKGSILIAGDHILSDITPNITGWLDDENRLSLYLESLSKVAALSIETLLPGHRGIIDNCRRRIGEIEAHHRKRSEEVMKILRDGPMTGSSVASRMTWDLRVRSWEAFPPAQRWFATGEALAHLRYLEAQGFVVKDLSTDGEYFAIQEEC